MKRQGKIISLLCKISKDVIPVSNAKIAAALYKKNKIISFGTNTVKSHPIQKRYSKHELAICQHAEINAIVNALRDRRSSDIKGASIYVIRTRRDGSMAMARPCDGCIKALLAFGISKMYYSNNYKEIICETLN